jgi:hypothetical protein
LNTGRAEYEAGVVASQQPGRSTYLGTEAEKFSPGGYMFFPNPFLAISNSSQSLTLSYYRYKSVTTKKNTVSKLIITQFMNQFL